MRLSNELWDGFVQRHHTKEPTVWRHAFAEPFAQMSEVFDWLLLAATRCEQGDDRIPYRLYSSGARLPDAAGHLPRRSDGSVAGYLDRLDRELGQVGLLVNELQAVHPAVWLRSIDFLRALYARVGMPAGYALLDIFSGSYTKGFFGVHKDDQDVFTIVLEGKKRLLVWPFEALADLPGAEGAEPWNVHDLSHVDIEAHRATATVLEGEPGDLLYWPASYWHVAETAGKREQVTTLSLGLRRHPDPTSGIALTMKELVDEERSAFSEWLPHPSLGGCDVATAMDRARNATRCMVESPAFADRHDVRLLERLTAFGFREVPDPLPAEPLEPTAVLCATSEQPVSWLRTGDDILWSAHGYAFRFPYHSGLERLFSRVCQGREEQVAEWIRAATGDSASGLPPDAVLHVIGMLLRHHAVRIVGR